MQRCLSAAFKGLSNTGGAGRTILKRFNHKEVLSAQFCGRGGPRRFKTFWTAKAAVRAISTLCNTPGAVCAISNPSTTGWGVPVPLYNLPNTRAVGWGIALPTHSLHHPLISGMLVMLFKFCIAAAMYGCDSIVMFNFISRGLPIIF